MFTFSSQQLQKWYFLKNRIPVISVLTWVVFFTIRPFILGFYHDDWPVIVEVSSHGGAFSWERLSSEMSIFGNRVLLGLLHFLISSTCGKSPIAWHIAIILINLFVAFSIWNFSKSLLKFLDTDSSNNTNFLLADISAAFWLMSPWHLGASIWPTLGPCNLSLVFFAWSGIFLFNGWNKGEIYFFKPYFFYLISCLIYESFYLQFLILIMIGSSKFFLKKDNKYPTKLVIIPLLLYCCTQTIVLFYNRIVAKYYKNSKILDDNWISKFFNSIINLPDILLQSLEEYKQPLTILIFIWFLLLLIATAKGLLGKNRNIKVTLQIWLTILFFFISIILSIFIYSLAGYGIYSIGIPSRTTLGMSFSISIIIGLILKILNNIKYIPLKKLNIVIVSSIAVFMISATLLRTSAWAISWQLQKDILTSAPIEQIRNISDQAVIITILPYQYQRVFVFAAVWDINAAMNSTYQIQKKFLPHYKGFTTIWDGKTIDQTISSYWQGKTKANEVYVWQYQTKFYKAKVPLNLDSGIGYSTTQID